MAEAACEAVAAKAPMYPHHRWWVEVIVAVAIVTAVVIFVVTGLS